MTVAIAMSVYYKDSPFFLAQSIDSMLNQTHSDIDIFIAVDGCVGEPLMTVLKKFENLNNVFVFYNTTNKGLAFRLNQLIEFILSANKYDFIARMDADDISVSDRIKLQVDFLNQNTDVSVVGSDLIEIDGSGKKLFYKKMPSKHSSLLKNIIRKCPLNHPSVLFRTCVFKSGLRYNSNLMNTQDYYLWVDMFYSGFVFANINQPLLMFRVTDDFYNKRGFSKAINDFRSRIYAMQKLDLFTPVNIFYSISLLFLRLAPSFVKKIAYSFFR